MRVVLGLSWGKGKEKANFCLGFGVLVFKLGVWGQSFRVRGLRSRDWGLG